MPPPPDRLFVPIEGMLDLVLIKKHKSIVARTRRHPPQKASHSAYRDPSPESQKELYFFPKSLLLFSFGQPGHAFTVASERISVHGFLEKRPFPGYHKERKLLQKASSPSAIAIEGMH